MGDRRTSLLMDYSPAPFLIGPGNGLVDTTTVFGQLAFDQGDISSLKDAALSLIKYTLVGKLAFPDEDQSRSVPIQAVYGRKRVFRPNPCQ